MQGCAVCGEAGLSETCSEEGCCQQLHPWCAAYQGLGGRCPQHCLSRRADWKATAPLQAAQMLSDSKAVTDFRAREGPAICTGAVFWYVFGSQYFPCFEASLLPDFLSLPSAVSWDPPHFDQASLELALTEVQTRKKTLLAELEARGKDAGRLRSTEDEWILKELKGLEYKKANREYLKYFEERERVVLPDPPALNPRSLEPPPNEEDFTCSICGDGDYESDNLIVICAVCELGQHMKCYGITRVPAGDWVCEVCRVFGREGASGLPCAFCPVKGGGLKPTLHANDGSLDTCHYPKYDSSQRESVSNPSAVWVHVFCAVHVTGVVIQDKERVEGIYVGAVEPQRFRLKCEVCGTRYGACVQCSHKKCPAAFHPECAKTLFLYTRDKYGSNEDNAVFCAQHRTMKLRKFVELKEKHQLEEINFCLRRWEKFFGKRVASRKQFTAEESEMLANRVKEFLRTLRFGPMKPFTLTVSAGGVEVTAPETYNLLEPGVLVQKGITVAGRTPEQCSRHYEESLYAVMKKELETAGKQVRLYARQHKAKRHTKARPKPPVKKPQMIVLPERPIVTEELFCVCRRPYIQVLPRLLGEAELDYERKLQANSMVQCSSCEDWFHQGCVHYSGFTAESEQNEDWRCPKCS